MHKRVIKLQELSTKKSLFLFGPRSTGKSTLLRKIFSDKQIINLLKSDIFLKLSERPSLLREIAKDLREKKIITKNTPIIIDEIQKIPQLLDEVHLLIEEEKFSFILTGSSARKLKRHGVNLLAGRAWECQLFPLTYSELENFNFEKYLLYGGLPVVFDSESPLEELDAYINTYLKEEIKEEALVQKIIPFARFLKVAALSNSEQINYANIANDSGIPASSVRAYYDILVDTFIGFTLEPWRASKKRKAITTAKFYFFDIGVANFLSEINELNAKSEEFGRAFEHFIALELRAYLSYARIKKNLTFWRTESHCEVDFIIGNEIAIEVKSTKKVTDKHLSMLRKLEEEKIIKKFYLISLDKMERVTDDNIHIIYWESFLQDLWSNKII
jgi:predicted AAA+ superfamily ATPase